ncbi:MAG TPA: ABC transporter ATP-binding protein [Anaerolineaceae bacterium]|nr:ABC transporter ATP-binding protein [Anaerolineaceae bacterium]
MYTVRKILSFVKPYWKLALLALALLFLRVSMDLSIPRLVQRIIDQGTNQKDLQVVITTSLMMVGVTILDAAAAVGSSISSVNVGQKVSRDLRKAIFMKVQSFSYGNLDQFNTGKLMVRMTADTDAVQRFVQVSLRIGASAPLTLIGSITLMYLTNHRLALSLLPLHLVVGVVLVLFSNRMEPLYLKIQTRLDWLNNVLQENIAGARLVKAFVRSGHESQRFESANTSYTDAMVSVMQLNAWMSPIVTLLINAGLVYTVWKGGLSAMDGSMTLGQLVAFINYLVATLAPLMQMSVVAVAWANGLASARRVNEVLDAVPEVMEPVNGIILSASDRPGVIFEHVSFHYNGSESRLVLKDISLAAAPGQTIAILGATGAGKSTLVNLIPRFYDASEGSVSVGGVDVRQVCEDSLLSRVSIVPQETVLFSGTIRENIRYGRPSATEEEVVAAAKAAQAHDFILAFPEGYDSRVEERGSNLSGGQKQRLGIARAIVTQPDILILDDSTSAVDVETETLIQSALAVTMRGRISFVVAQRISTVLNADKIIVLDRGQIVAEGTHAELMQSSPVYREIYDSQLGSDVGQMPIEVQPSLAGGEI